MTLLLLLNIVDFDDHSTSEKNGHTLDICVDEGDVFSVCVGQADLYNVRKPLTQFLGVGAHSHPETAVCWSLSSCLIYLLNM